MKNPLYRRAALCSVFVVSLLIWGAAGLFLAFPSYAQLVVGTMGGMATYGGFWIDKDGTTKIQGVVAIYPSGNFTETALTTSLTAAAATVLNVNPTGRRTALVIEINTASSTITCTDDGSVPVIQTAPGLSATGINGILNYHAYGLVPAGAIKCIASQATAITVRAQ